ncbi:MAG: sugar phosphate isomerase/epimerase, partial [Clostridia bacterium]|nr:sugar phosphate isomerase/epimerase [Clostridia bacterium]
KLGELGAKVCEVFFASFCEYNSDFARQLKGIADSAGVRVHSVHALTNQFEPELFSKGVRARSDAFKIFDSVCAAGEAMGAGYYTFHGATRLKPAVKYTFDYPFLAERVNMLIDAAEAHGITFTYENVHWTYFSTPDYFAPLKALCPRLCTTLDIKQAMQSKVDYKDYLAVMGDSLRTVHLCNYDEGGKLLMPHDKSGAVDFKDLFKRLKGQGYDGPCFIEVYDKCYDDFKEIGYSLDYLGDMLTAIQ